MLDDYYSSSRGQAEKRQVSGGSVFSPVFRALASCLRLRVSASSTRILLYRPQLVCNRVTCRFSVFAPNRYRLPTQKPRRYRDGRLNLTQKDLCTSSPDTWM